MRHNRANMKDTLRLANIIACRYKGIRYVYDTAYGYVIGSIPPPGHQEYLRVTPTVTEIIENRQPSNR